MWTVFWLFRILVTNSISGYYRNTGNYEVVFYTNTPNRTKEIRINQTAKMDKKSFIEYSDKADQTFNDEKVENGSKFPWIYAVLTETNPRCRMPKYAGMHRICIAKKTIDTCRGHMKIYIKEAGLGHVSKIKTTGIYNIGGSECVCSTHIIDDISHFSEDYCGFSPTKIHCKNGRFTIIDKDPHDKN